MVSSLFFQIRKKAPSQKGTRPARGSTLLPADNRRPCRRSSASDNGPVAGKRLSRFMPGFTFAALGWSIRCRAIGGSQPKAPFSVWPDNRSLSPSLHLEEVLNLSYEKLDEFATGDLIHQNLMCDRVRSTALSAIFSVQLYRNSHRTDPLHDTPGLDDFLISALCIRQVSLHLFVVEIRGEERR